MSKDLKDYLIITKKNTNYSGNQLILNNDPIKFSSLLEQIHIQYLKIHFNKKSDYKIGQYILDVNSREIILNSNRLKLTERETDTIIYLSKSNITLRLSLYSSEFKIDLSILSREYLFLISLNKSDSSQFLPNNLL